MDDPPKSLAHVFPPQAGPDGTRGRMGRPVVDDDDLDCLVILCVQGPKGGFDVPLVPPGGQDDADEGCRPRPGHSGHSTVIAECSDSMAPPRPSAAGTMASSLYEPGSTAAMFR